MRRRYFAMLAGVVLATGFALPGSASAAESNPDSHCAASFDAAVHEDNDAYAAKDAQRYEAILNPRMIFAYDGQVTYGRDAIMETARQNFAIEGWTWTYTILSETVYGCHAGIAVLDAYVLFPARTNRHFAATMTLVRERGKWTVAMDNVHLLPS